MKNLKFILCALIAITSIAFSQQGKYTRKSVSSLESVWIKGGANNFNFKTFDKFIDFYVEVERFDYNVLPEKYLQEFRKEASKKTSITPDALAEVLESTVVKKIKRILNDPEVVKNRGKLIKDESSFQSFAATKGRSLGLTADELAVLMNSAYIYLPYITSIENSVEDNIVTYEINGGLIWWQIKIDSDGKTSVKQILTAETMSLGSADRSAKSVITKKSIWPKDYVFGNERWKVNADEYAKTDAMLAFAKNLGVKTKKIDAFKLTAQIAEARGRKYGFPLGFREGVHLDDVFDLVEYVEDETGNEVVQNVGFVRVKKTGNNIDDPTSFTYAKQLLGRKQGIGGVVMEHPVLGIDYRLKAGYISELFIPKTAIFNPRNGVEYFEKNIESAFAIETEFKYNLAPILGISQTFYDLNIGFALPAFKPNDDDAENQINTVIPIMVNSYAGLTKKIWFRSLNLSLGAGLGAEYIGVSDTASYTSGIEYNFSWSALAVTYKYGIDIEKMLSPDLSFNLGITYKSAITTDVSIEWTTKEAGVEEEFSIDNKTDYDAGFANYNRTWEGDGYDDIILGSTTVTFGINYALGELPVNLFGFLDPFKKY